MNSVRRNKLPTVVRVPQSFKNHGIGWRIKNERCFIGHDSKKTFKNQVVKFIDY